MKIDRDAMGHLMYDYLMGKRPSEIVERDDGYIDTSSGPEAYFAEFWDWPECEKEAMEWVKGRVLDIGCGAGRHCLYLQGKGHEVVGIDSSPLAIKVCKERGVKEARVMSITQIGPRLGRFDTVLMMGNNFGLLGGMKRGRWLLRKLNAMTNPNAKIIGESNDPYKTTNPCHLEYHELNRKRGRMPGQVRIRVRYQRYASEWFDYLLVSPEEMGEVVSDTAWSIQRFIKSDGSMYVGILGKGKSGIRATRIR